MKRFFYIILLFASCKEEYNPPLKHGNLDYLVVEGNIVAGDDSTFIHLTRTVTVSDTSVAQPETNATITVESDGGESYPLQNEFNGFYFAPPLHINNANKYRLHIFTGDGKEYASDYVPVKETPPIDSISWKLDEKGVSIYANTHDATNSSQYYRWAYEETWEHHSKQYSVLVFDPASGTVRPRTPEEQIYHCWNIDTSTNILIASTAGLSSDIVFEKPLVQLPYLSTKLSVVYSINVVQNVLTKEGYEFWQNLKKNTEQLGSIFDPQPFSDYGNMHCISNPDEPVIGFITACTMQQQRIYIFWNQVRWPFNYPAECKDSLVTQDKIAEVFSIPVLLPVTRTLMPPGAVIGDFANCVDCKLTGGGSYIKPPYMP